MTPSKKSTVLCHRRYEYRRDFCHNACQIPLANDLSEPLIIKVRITVIICSHMQSHAATCSPMQQHATTCSHMQHHGATCSSMPSHRIPCRLMLTHSDPCRFMHAHTGPCRHFRAHALPRGTMRRHAETFTIMQARKLHQPGLPQDRI